MTKYYFLAFCRTFYFLSKKLVFDYGLSDNLEIERVIEMKKTVVITGASSGIGKATALMLGKKDYQVVLGARRENKLVEIKEQIEKEDGTAIYQVTDVTKAEEVQKLADIAHDKFGQIDIWINCAGIMPQSMLAEKRINDWDNMLDINVKGTLYGIAAALTYMVPAKKGHIINISSIAAHAVGVGTSVYSATKAAVNAISEGLRQEMAQMKTNIRVTVVSPGAINTNLLNSITSEDVKKFVTDFYDNYAIPVDRIAKVIADAIEMPEDTTLNEIIVRSTAQEL